MTGQKRLKVAFYARVSTDGQDCDNQLRQLYEAAERKGWEVVREYVDKGVSGSKGRDGRPEFDALIKDATSPERPYDMVAAFAVDRFGRSLIDLVKFLTDMQKAGVGIYMHLQQVDSSTPAGAAMFQMLGVFAQFERSLIVDRVNAGLDRARADGVKLGRRSVEAEHPEAIAKVDALLLLPPEERPSLLSISNTVTYVDGRGRSRYVSRTVVRNRARALGVLEEGARNLPSPTRQLHVAGAPKIPRDRERLLARELASPVRKPFRQIARIAKVSEGTVRNRAKVLEVGSGYARGGADV